MGRKMIYTFWEGEKPAYIELCMETWEFDHVILNYDNLGQYTDISDKVRRFTLPQIADCVRVHVLRDNGGVWLDADTISINGELPKEKILGYPDTWHNTIGFLRADKDMFDEWARYQDEVIEREDTPSHWAVMGNYFTDRYLAENDIEIGDVKSRWAETYMIRYGERYQRYLQFYFEWHKQLEDLLPTDILMLHNSWTPEWYKKLNREEVLSLDCTLSNILKKL